MPVIDLTKTTEYRNSMQPLIDKWKWLLDELGYDPKTEWDTCEWLVWGWENSD